MLEFGWKQREERETIWHEDPALTNVPQSAIVAWAEDGDASHLRAYALAGPPNVFTYRSLTSDEREYVRGFFVDPGPDSYKRAAYAAFRIAVNFPDAPAFCRDQNGAQHPTVTKVRGIPMLADEFVMALEEKYQGIVYFYGDIIVGGAFLSEVQKKALLRRRTETPLPADPVATAATADQAKTDEAAA